MKIVTLAEAQHLVGQDLGVSEWTLIDQKMIDAFADVTGDRQFIHVDPDLAMQTPFGGTIAHGFLTLSLIASMMPENALVLDGIKMGVNYGFEKVRFLQPVKSGKRVRARRSPLASRWLPRYSTVAWSALLWARWARAS